MQQNRSYKISFLCAVILHLLILSFLFIKFAHDLQQSPADQDVNIIQATTIDQSALNQIAAAKQLQEQHEKEKAEALQQQQEQMELAKQQALEQQKIEQQKIEQARIQEEKLQQQKLEEAKIAQQKAAAEKLAKARAIKEAAIKALQKHILEEQNSEAANIKTEEKATTAALAQKQKQLLAQVTAQQMALEGKALKANSAKTAAQNQGEIDKYKALIIQAISQEWIIPNDIDPNSTCVLLVELAPDGVVLNVTISQASGNPLLDRSAKTAVLKASPLPTPKDGALFENFRNLRLIVKPEGIQA